MATGAWLGGSGSVGGSLSPQEARQTVAKAATAWATRRRRMAMNGVERVRLSSIVSWPSGLRCRVVSSGITDIRSDRHH